MAGSQPPFNLDIELEIIDLATEELRSRFLTRFGAYLSALVGILIAILTLTLTGTGSNYGIFNLIALPLAAIIGVVVFIYASQDAIEYRRQLRRVDDLITDVRNGRSLGNVGDAIGRLRRR